METKERRHIIFFGAVQGVGFRATAQRLTQGLPITGFVRNLPNGAVELVVEGETLALDQYLARLGARMAGYIERSECQQLPAEGLTGFSIRL
jgi:acylphosphatase